MKLSDYVASFLAQQGIRHAFVVSGGASLHLIHSIAEQPGIEHICPQHEQAGAMAADAYARVTGNLGAAVATSGPGATNLITGICCAYYDSVPVLFITGQVATFRFKDDTGVRQIGFQETDTVDMCKYVTKYAFFCNVEIKPEHRAIPQVKFGRSLEDMDPPLNRSEFLQNMIVKPDPASLQ